MTNTQRDEIGMKRMSIAIDGKHTIHLSGAAVDATLCGTEMYGDSKIGAEPGEETTDKVNCAQCMQIIFYCKKVPGRWMLPQKRGR